MPEQYYPFNTHKSPTIHNVGGKAMSLITSTNARLPVPKGFVLTVAFFKPWNQQIKNSNAWKELLADPDKEHCNNVKGIAEALTLTDEQQGLLRLAIQSTMKDTAIFAVRSSSPEEDLKEISFAGMYDTYLGTNTDALEKNIAKVYASMFDFRVIEYKHKNNMSLETATISVIIQKQIVSETSGVGFSLNPLNNCYDEAVINASFGLGEAIVSGIVTPDTYVVEKVGMSILDSTISNKKIIMRLNDHGGTERCENTKGEIPALTNKQILEVTGLIKKCEEQYGYPVDIEWAYEKDTLYLLQVRPITTYIPLFPKMLTKPGERKKLYVDVMPLTQGFDEPLSVLGADIWSIVLERFKMGSVPAGDDGYVLNIGGRQYIQIHNLFKGYGKRMGLKMLSTFDIALKEHEDSIYKEYISLKASPLVKQGKKSQLRMSMIYIPQIIKALLYPEKQSHIMNNITDDMMTMFKELQNDRRFDELIEYCFAAFDPTLKNMMVFISAFLAERKIKKMMKNTEAEEYVKSVLMDLPSNPTSAMGHAMFNLANFEDLQKTVDGTEFKQKISERSYSDEFLAAFDDYMYRYGDRGFKEIDPASKRTSEKLDELFIQLKSINIEENQMLKVKAKKEKAFEVMRSVAQKKGKLKAFNKAIDIINMTYGFREIPKYLFVVMNGGVRRIALEIADGFVKEERLSHRNQIFSLTIDQISRAQEDSTLELLPLIEQNLAPREIMKHVKQFPAFIDSRGKIFKNRIEPGAKDLTGMAISNGIIKGKARVLKSPYEKPLLPGEILVAVATEPSWTPVFTNASGVVLEVGGQLQHGAIIAREYGIPCVSSLPGATKMIDDGDLIEVDGTHGIVKILEKAA